MSGPIIDITRPLGPATVVYPGDPPVEIAQISSVDGSGVALSRLSLSSHAGTHIDPPAHLFPGGLTVDALSLALLIGPALLVSAAHGRPVTDADLADIPPTERLLVSTGGQPITENAARRLLARGLRLVGVDGLSVDGEGNGLPVHRLLLSAGVIIVEGLALEGVAPGAYTLVCLPLRLVDGDGAPARAVLLPAGFSRRTPAP